MSITTAEKTAMSRKPPIEDTTSKPM